MGIFKDSDLTGNEKFGTREFLDMHDPNQTNFKLRGINLSRQTRKILQLQDPLTFGVLLDANTTDLEQLGSDRRNYAINQNLRNGKCHTIADNNS